MTSENINEKFLSRGIDYLSDLGTKLRDLKGFSTLAHELIQNAEDASNATSISFIIDENALIVENNGIFSDCGHMESDDCPWKNDNDHGYSCDFHRFRHVASGDKRNQAETVGTFGIGFITVYQITDQPEIISNGRHWIINEVEIETKRIKVCPGCPVCQEKILPGTRFIFPWAFNQNSLMRKGLKVQAIRKNDLNRFPVELEQSIPNAMIFLKKIECVKLINGSSEPKSFVKLSENNTLIINDQIWHLIYGNFNNEATLLKKKYPNIEEKRSSKVTMAIPEETLGKGLLYAFLPTQHETGLPFHINADFFPENNRKRVILESDFQSEWNKAILKAAAIIFKDNFNEIFIKFRDDYKRLWNLIDSIYKVYQGTKEKSSSEYLKNFWVELQPILENSAVIFSTQKKWENPSHIHLLESEDEYDAVTILEQLDIPIVHSDLRRYYSIILSLKVNILKIQDIAEALHKFGLNKRTEPSDLPSFLSDKTNLEILWTEIISLLKKARKKDEQISITECSISLGRDGALWPCNKIYDAEEETIILFSKINPTFPFLAKVEEKFHAIKELSPKFTIESAIEMIENIGEVEINKLYKKENIDPDKLLKWFKSRSKGINSELNNKIANLPIFPTIDELKPLSHLALPGDFTDPIGITDIIDLNQLQGHRDFLVELGAQELNFKKYVSDYYPCIFEDNTIDSGKKRKAIMLATEHFGKIKDNIDIKKRLKNLPIIECNDGIYREPHKVYFNSGEISDILGNGVHTALIQPEKKEIITDFYTWLGVNIEPSYADIVKHIKEIVAHQPTPKLIEKIEYNFEYLGKRIENDENELTDLLELKSLAWLPALKNNEQWFHPLKLYTTFRSYLFESQAKFLHFPYNVQKKSARFLKFLEINTEPTVEQVVKHLIDYSEQKREIHKEVYRFLNDNADNSLLDQLKDIPSLLLPNQKYVKPNQVFWGKHPFGRFRYQLGSDLRVYNKLFEKLGVKEFPNHEDALKVLLEISEEFGKFNTSLDPETNAILIECWKVLQKALEAEEISEQEFDILLDKKIIPNAKHLLYDPKLIFFEDRAGLATKFGDYLSNNVIPHIQDAWKAMEVAGVKNLSSVIKINIVECLDPISENSVTTKIQNSRTHLNRIIPQDIKINESVLDNLGCQSVSELKVQYSLDAFKREIRSEPEDVPAHFNRDQNILFYVRKNRALIPWPTISRELAIALAPDIEPGQLALGIKEILAANSEDEAQGILDELGFPPLEKGSEISIESDCITDLGGHTSLLNEDTTTTQPENEKTLISDASNIDTNSHENSDNVEGGQRPTGAPTTGTATTGTATTGTATTRTPKNKQGKLRTYVSPKDDQIKTENPEKTIQRSEVDQAGIKKVLRYEQAKGRTPIEMPHNHPGYDIESSNSEGKVRYIEVKSISGKWGSLGVSLSKTQFEKAIELGSYYWLYVVEQAQNDDSSIIKIQNPAEQVNQFIYDSGWRDVADNNDHNSHSNFQIGDHISYNNGQEGIILKIDQKGHTRVLTLKLPDGSTKPMPLNITTMKVMSKN